MKNIISKLLLVTSALLLSSLSHAVAPANATITNQASLSYAGLTGSITASVDITVSLSPSAPTLSAPADNTVAESQSSTFNYTITSTANGSDAYNLSSAAPVLTNITGAPAVSFEQGGIATTAVTLGATAASVAQTAGNTTVTAPSDGTADAAANNITAGDTVVINGVSYAVTTVVDDGTTAVITLGAVLAANVNVGDLIAEQQAFDMIIDNVGNVTVSGVAATVDVTITAAAASGANPSNNDATTTNVVEVTFSKFVRNVTNPNGTPPAAVTFNTNDYFDTADNVSATSADVLEYLITVTAPAGTTLTTAQFTDAVGSIPFTTYVASSTELNTNPVADVGGNSPLETGMAVNDPGSPAGTVAASQTANVTFRVTLD